MLPDSSGGEVLGLTSALLLTSYSRMAVETTRRLIPQVRYGLGKRIYKL